MQFGRKISHFALSILLGYYAMGSKPSQALENTFPVLGMHAYMCDHV